MSRLTIGVVPIYGRCKLATWCLQKAKVLPGVDHIIAVGSSTDDEEAAKVAGVEYHYCNNKPIGLKWQLCFDLALQQGADGVLFLQSDDVWQADMVDKLWVELDKGADLAGLSTWYLVLLSTGDVYYERYKTRLDSLGTGRLYSAGFLKDKLDGKLFLEGACLREMDKYASWRIREADGKEVTIDNAPAACLKLWEGVNDIQVTAASTLLESENVISEKTFTSFTNNILFEWREYNG